jgi:hypothetical protein
LLDFESNYCYLVRGWWQHLMPPKPRGNCFERWWHHFFCQLKKGLFSVKLNRDFRGPARECNKAVHSIDYRISRSSCVFLFLRSGSSRILHEMPATRHLKRIKIVSSSHKQRVCLAPLSIMYEIFWRVTELNGLVVCFRTHELILILVFTVQFLYVKSINIFIYTLNMKCFINGNLSYVNATVKW